MKTAFLYNQTDILSSFTPIDDNNGVITQPDMALSCRDIVSRYSRGLPVPHLRQSFDADEATDALMLANGDGLLDYIDKYQSLAISAREQYAQERAQAHEVEVSKADTTQPVDTPSSEA